MFGCSSSWHRPPNLPERRDRGSRLRTSGRTNVGTGVYTYPCPVPTFVQRPDSVRPDVLSRRSRRSEGGSWVFQPADAAFALCAAFWHVARQVKFLYQLVSNQLGNCACHAVAGQTGKGACRRAAETQGLRILLLENGKHLRGVLPHLSGLGAILGVVGDLGIILAGLGCRGNGDLPDPAGEVVAQASVVNAYLPAAALPSAAPTDEPEFVFPRIGLEPFLAAGE